MRQMTLAAIMAGAILLFAAPANSATLDGNPYNEFFSTNFTPQAALPLFLPDPVVGPGPFATLTGGAAWIVGIVPLYDVADIGGPFAIPADPNAWTGAAGTLLTISFSVPMQVVEFYEASLGGSTITILDPINGNTVIAGTVVPLAGLPGIGTTRSFGGHITGLTMLVGTGFAAIDSLGFTPIPVPAAFPLLLSAIAGVGFVARRKRP